MALISFIIPTDTDILKDLKKEPQLIKFIGTGRFSQKQGEIKFYRLFKHTNDCENLLQQVIYQRNGLVWEFKQVVVVNKEEVNTL